MPDQNDPYLQKTIRFFVSRTGGREILFSLAVIWFIALQLSYLMVYVVYDEWGNYLEHFQVCHIVFLFALPGSLSYLFGVTENFLSDPPTAFTVVYYTVFIIHVGLIILLRWRILVYIFGLLFLLSSLFWGISAFAMFSV